MSLKTRTTAAVVSQFHLPRGLPGALAGWVMAHRASNVARNRWAVSLLDLGPADDFLELGFGPGVAVEEAARRAGRVYGLDHSEVMVRQATRRNAAAIREGRADLRRGTASDLGVFGGVRFDAVLTVNSAQFWPDPVGVLEAVRAEMAPGGRVVLASQPRGPGVTDEDVEPAGAELADLLTDAGYGEIRRERLALQPVSVAAALGVRR